MEMSYIGAIIMLGITADKKNKLHEFHVKMSQTSTVYINTWFLAVTLKISHLERQVFVPPLLQDYVRG